MDQRLKGSPISTWHGIDFTTQLGDRAILCRLAPETLIYLRDRFAPGLRDSPLGLFRRLWDEVMTVAVWKETQGAFETDGTMHLLVEDAKQAL